MKNDERPLCATCHGNGVVNIPGGISVCPGCHGDCWATGVASADARWQRLYNLIASLAHPNGDCRQNDLEDEAHDLIRELRASPAPAARAPHPQQEDEETKSFTEETKSFTRVDGE